ncbi:premnaspirodiene oxygenase-like [Olea europaea var. sylvestris]|uniref:premnaspirodiene oxygenase-like n=1 Tax=Olea europaea var. sylvestris TaxID=158386 RepID=UPI000C1D4870|nr:premnaspirodiene oxygenase-like [Olea europaea var. sylvestris]
MEILSNKKVRSYGHIRHDEISKLIRSIRSHGEPFNVTNMLLSYTSSVTARAAFGGMLKEQDTLISFMKIGVAFAGGFELADLYPSLKFLQILSWNKHQLLKMRRKLDSILDVMLNEHKHKLAREKRDNGELVSENIVDVPLQKQQSEDLDVPITDDDIKATIFDMFMAGTETSSTTFDWAMTELMRNP